MMDTQFWIYVIVGVIIFLTRMLKKNEQEGQPPQQSPERRPRRPEQSSSGEAPRQLTFEELLREITEGKRAQQAPPERSRPSAMSEPEPDDEGRSLEEIPSERDDSRVFQAYEEAKRLASQRTSLEDTLKLQDTQMKFGKFKAFEAKQTTNKLNSYINIIRNPETLKQAVVMSEVLKRKF
jgi:hypothetical protein